MFVDIPLQELREYRPDVAEPPDFDEFWSAQLGAARAFDTAPTFTQLPTALTSTQVFDVTFPGHGGAAIRAWLLVPAQLSASDAFIVSFVGYNGGRGDPLEWLTWSATGVPHLVMDSRGQGGGWRAADTPDPAFVGEPGPLGFMTRGIADPAEHYFTRLFVDAVRAIDAVVDNPVSSGRRLVTTGGSQGGALSIVTAALHPAVTATMPDVPFLAHPRHAVEITDSMPFGELVEYCALYPARVDRVFETLSYIDVVNHAKRAKVPALFSVALLDDIAPPSTVFAAYNHYHGPKDIAVYPFNDHSGGGIAQLRRQIEFLQSR